MPQPQPCYGCIYAASDCPTALKTPEPLCCGLVKSARMNFGHCLRLKQVQITRQRSLEVRSCSPKPPSMCHLTPHYTLFAFMLSRGCHIRRISVLPESTTPCEVGGDQSVLEKASSRTSVAWTSICVLSRPYSTRLSQLRCL